MKTLRLILSTLILAACSSTYAGSCAIKEQKCIEGPDTRSIQGLLVHRECWKYEDSYTCVEPDSLDKCKDLEAQPACAQLTATCAQNSLVNGDCLSTTNTYQCANVEVPVTPEFTQLASTWKVSKDLVDDQCVSRATNAKCTMQEKQCTQAGGTRVINGLPVTKDCWEWTSKYVCLDPQAGNSECGSLAVDSDCKLVESKCARDATGKDDCTITTNTYKCQVNAGNTVAETTCGKTTCIAGVCFDNDDGNDKDFAKTITMLELQRQAAMYKDNTDGLMFKGVGNNCEKRLFGASNCCAGKVVAGADNSAIANVAMAFAYEGVKYLGSKYVFDPLMQQGKALFGDAISALYGSAAANTAESGALIADTAGGAATVANGYDTSLGSGAYGLDESATTYVTDSATSTAVESGSTAAATAAEGSAANAASSGFSFGAYGVSVNFTTLASAISNGTSMMDAFSFSPWGFAIAVAIKVITEMMQCNEEEQLLSMRKGSGLCAYVGSYSRGSIYKRKFEGYCCFNSKLARIVQEQGRPQLKKTFGNPENPNCSGLSQADLEGIDFSKIDFGEFLQDVTSKAANTAAMTSRALDRVKDGKEGSPIVNPVIAQDVPDGTSKPISPEQLANLYARLQPPVEGPSNTTSAPTQSSAGGCTAPASYEEATGGCIDKVTNQYYYPFNGGAMPCAPGYVKDSEREACVDPKTDQYYFLNSTTAMPCKPSFFFDAKLKTCIDVGLKAAPR